MKHPDPLNRWRWHRRSVHPSRPADRLRAWLLEAWRKVTTPAGALLLSAAAFSVFHPMGLLANLVFLLPGMKQLVACHPLAASSAVFQPISASRSA